MGLIPGSGRSPGGGHGNTLQYSCLETHGHRSPAVYSPIGLPRVGLIEVTKHAHTQGQVIHGAATLNSRKKVKAGLNCLIDIETGRKTEKDALGQFILIL